MSLAEFGPIHVKEGHLYELSRGVIEVSDVPSIFHARQINAVRKTFDRYDDVHPGLIRMVLGGGEAKTTVPPTESERHPDLSIYLTDPPPGPQPWDDWTASIVIEIVSRSSIRRDYDAKAEDYWHAGAGEYVLFDSFRRQVLLHRRGADGWERIVLTAADTYRTDLLPGFEMPCGPVLDLGEPADDSDDD